MLQYYPERGGMRLDENGAIYFVSAPLRQRTEDNMEQIQDSGTRQRVTVDDLYERAYPDSDYVSRMTPEAITSPAHREYQTGAVRDTAEGKGSMVSISWGALLRLSLILEKGAEHYGRFNYMKGMSLSDTMDSLGRHLGKYLDGWDDEDHLGAILFNAINAMETEDKHPELIDHPMRIGKKTFSYRERAKR